MLLEQFYDCVPDEIIIFLLEKSPKNLLKASRKEMNTR